MSEALPKSYRVTFQSLPNATFSLELEAGQLPLDLPVGQTIDLFGPAHHLASHLALLENKQEKATSDTSGQPFSISLESKRLQQSLENKLQAQLGTDGSTIYKKTWKNKTTPAQWQYCQLAASAHRTKGKDYGTSLINWPTPMQTDGSKRATVRENYQSGAGSDNSNVGMWRHGILPSTRDHKGGYVGGRIRNGKISTDTLDVTAQLVPWQTPRARGDAGGNRWKNQDIKNLEDQIRYNLMPGGNPLDGLVEMESRAPSQLNPRFSLWLMGYPIEWAHCAARVTPLSRKSRQK